MGGRVLGRRWPSMVRGVSRCLWLVFFFFQAEDGIRDLTVTGVQTCALPILGVARGGALRVVPPPGPALCGAARLLQPAALRRGTCRGGLGPERGDGDKRARPVRCVLSPSGVLLRFRPIHSRAGHAALRTAERVASHPAQEPCGGHSSGRSPRAEDNRAHHWEGSGASLPGTPRGHPGDRKSTRLNSSHSQISYAVFCLQKKKYHSLPCPRPVPVHPGRPRGPPPHREVPSTARLSQLPSYRTSDASLPRRPL